MAKKILTKKCEICGKAFHTSSETARYCESCRKAAYLRNKRERRKAKMVPQERQCPICGASFMVPSANSRRVYCPTCVKKLRNTKMIGHADAIVKMKEFQRKNAERHWPEILAESERNRREHRRSMGLKESGLGTSERAAKALGMTYGQYVAHKHAGATIEPVRAGNLAFDEWIGKICGGRK